jgi:uncharacterized protein YjbI with pentapeptide repeats
MEYNLDMFDNAFGGNSDILGHVFFQFADYDMLYKLYKRIKHKPGQLTERELKLKSIVKTELKKRQLKNADLHFTTQNQNWTDNVQLLLYYVKLARAKNRPIYRINLQGVDLSGMNLSGIEFIEANFTDANLTNVNFRRAVLRSANFTNTNLNGANLESVDLEDADLEDADLEGANLMYANLNGANLEGANLEGANLEGANIDEAEF